MYFVLLFSLGQLCWCQWATPLPTYSPQKWHPYQRPSLIPSAPYHGYRYKSYTPHSASFYQRHQGEKRIDSENVSFEDSTPSPFNAASHPETTDSFLAATTLLPTHTDPQQNTELVPENITILPDYERNEEALITTTASSFRPISMKPVEVILNSHELKKDNSMKTEEKEADTDTTIDSVLGTETTTDISLNVDILLHESEYIINNGSDDFEQTDVSVPDIVPLEAQTLRDSNTSTARPIPVVKANNLLNSTAESSTETNIYRPLYGSRLSVDSFGSGHSLRPSQRVTSPPLTAHQLNDQLKTKPSEYSGSISSHLTEHDWPTSPNSSQPNELVDPYAIPLSQKPNQYFLSQTGKPNTAAAQDLQVRPPSGFYPQLNTSPQQPVTASLEHNNSQQRIPSVFNNEHGSSLFVKQIGNSQMQTKSKNDPSLHISQVKQFLQPALVGSQQVKVTSTPSKVASSGQTDVSSLQNSSSVSFSRPLYNTQQSINYHYVPTTTPYPQPTSYFRRPILTGNGYHPVTPRHPLLVIGNPTGQKLQQVLGPVLGPTPGANWRFPVQEQYAHKKESISPDSVGVYSNHPGRKDSGAVILIDGFTRSPPIPYTTETIRYSNRFTGSYRYPYRPFFHHYARKSPNRTTSVATSLSSLGSVVSNKKNASQIHMQRDSTQDINEGNSAEIINSKVKYALEGSKISNTSQEILPQFSPASGKKFSLWETDTDNEDIDINKSSSDINSGTISTSVIVTTAQESILNDEYTENQYSENKDSMRVHSVVTDRASVVDPGSVLFPDILTTLTPSINEPEHTSTTYNPKPSSADVTLNIPATDAIPSTTTHVVEYTEDNGETSSQILSLAASGPLQPVSLHLPILQSQNTPSDDQLILGEIPIEPISIPNEEFAQNSNATWSPIQGFQNSETYVTRDSFLIYTKDTLKGSKEYNLTDSAGHKKLQADPIDVRFVDYHPGQPQVVKYSDQKKNVDTENSWTPVTPQYHHNEQINIQSYTLTTPLQLTNLDDLDNQAITSFNPPLSKAVFSPADIEPPTNKRPFKIITRHPIVPNKRFQLPRRIKPMTSLNYASSQPKNVTQSLHIEDEIGKNKDSEYQRTSQMENIKKFEIGNQTINTLNQTDAPVFMETVSENPISSLGKLESRRMEEILNALPDFMRGIVTVDPKSLSGHARAAVSRSYGNVALQARGNTLITSLEPSG